MLDERLEPAAILERDRGPGLRLADPRDHRGHHAIAQSHDRRLSDPLVCEFLDARGSCRNRHGRGEIDAELSLEARLRRSLARQLEHERVYRQLDPFDRVGCELVRGAQLKARINHRMQHDTAGERLVRVQEDFIVLAETPVIWA